MKTPVQAASPQAVHEVTQVKASGSRGFRLLQITDCHLPASPNTPYRGLRADTGLVAVVAAAAAWQPDAVILTGDLSEDASESSYQRLADHIGSLNVPVWALPGNHDLPERMQRYFPNGPYQGLFQQAAGAWQLFLLNSARPKRVDGSLEPADIKRVDACLTENPSRPALLALHHHPVPVGAPWIDKHMLDQPEDLLRCVTNHVNLKAVLWGHVHQPFETGYAHARFMSGPSAAANSLPGTERFSLNPTGPACRWLELFDDGRLETGILFGGES